MKSLKMHSQFKAGSKELSFYIVQSKLGSALAWLILNCIKFDCIAIIRFNPIYNVLGLGLGGDIQFLYISTS